MRFLVGAVASSAVWLLLAVGVQYSMARHAGPEWTVHRTTTAQHLMVVDVNARPSASLRLIGESILTGSIRDKYDEVLIYVRSGRTSVRRIQWTRRHGYGAELVIG
jgi:hypothetical protein